MLLQSFMTWALSRQPRGDQIADPDVHGSNLPGFDLILKCSSMFGRVTLLRTAHTSLVSEYQVEHV